MLIIGLDGLTFKVINPLIRSGHLPNISNFFKQGITGELKSTLPPVSGTAWHAFKTGKNPGKTGVYDFMKYNPHTNKTRIIHIAKVPGIKFWDIIEQYSESKLGIYNLPTTYPPSKINGFMVSGFPLADGTTDYTYPLKLKEELDDIVDGHKVDINYKDYENYESFLGDLNTLLNQRLKVYQYLRDKYDPEFFIFTLTCTDRLQHFMWKYISQENSLTNSHIKHYRTEVLNFWEHLDEILGEIINSVKKDTSIIILSDHGFGPQKEIFYINQWLMSHGYLKIISNKVTQEPEGIKLKSKFKAIINNLINNKEIPKYLLKISPNFIKEKLNKEISYNEILPHIDWKNTMAYTPPHTSIYGTIYLNLKGRESKGIVDRSVYETLRDELISELYSINNELNDFKIKVFKREDIYHGMHLKEAPDLVYIINDFRCIYRSSLCKGEFFKRKPLRSSYSGTHRMEGIFMAKGPHIKQGSSVKRARIIDIAPTILHLLNLPISIDMDGRVIKEIFYTNSNLAKRKVNLVKIERETESVEDIKFDDENIKKHLEDLGYL